MSTWITVFKVTQHTLSLGLLILAMVAYWVSVAKGRKHPVHGHVIFWLAWLGVAVIEAFFLWNDLR